MAMNIDKDTEFTMPHGSTGSLQLKSLNLHHRHPLPRQLLLRDTCAGGQEFFSLDVVEQLSEHQAPTIPTPDRQSTLDELLWTQIQDEVNRFEKQKGKFRKRFELRWRRI
ncbi:hypothetical protein GG344DRAFT_70598 [Lentinula edodes]|nr:hypothetical protein GG344DRAFT_70598 [Lentinula edodes]